MANQEHLNILAKGVEAWNAWRHGQLEGITTADYLDPWGELEAIPGNGVVPDLSRADLTGRNLAGIDLQHADLRAAVLRNANLEAAQLTGARLSSLLDNAADRLATERFTYRLRTSPMFLQSGSTVYYAMKRMERLIGADMTGANLRRADLTSADLRRAVCSKADLREVNFQGANLSGAIFREADLTDAVVGLTIFGSADLREANGIGTIKHHAPSTINLNTIVQDHSVFGVSFLRGIGAPEELVSYVTSLREVKFHSCFISYSAKDQEFADRLYADLQARGVRCWFANHDVKGGMKIHEQIDNAIRMSDKLLLILSDASMNSNWVKTEIANARAKERQQKRQMLFPITLVSFDRVREWTCFDADTGIDSAREIREYFIPDFSQWKDLDSYSRAFERLVRDLKAQTTDTSDGHHAE